MQGMFVIKNEVRRFFLSVGKTVTSELLSMYVSHLCLNSTGTGGVRTKSAWASLIIQLNQNERRGNVRYGEKNFMRMFHEMLRKLV